jgi:hypothetical protein
MIKRLNTFPSKNPIITKVITILILFVIFFSGYLFFKEFYLNNWKIKEGLDSPLPKIIVGITDNTGDLSDPNPNGIYTVIITSDNKPDKNNTYDLSLNGNVIINNSAFSTLEIEVIPKKTNIEKKHYADIFPEYYEIDYYFDPSSIVNFLPSNEDENNYNPRINITTDSLGSHKFYSTQLGIISDNSYNSYGYVRSDTSNPYHYFVLIKKPIDLSSVKITFTKKPEK